MMVSPGFEQRAEAGDRLFGDLAGRQHHPGGRAVSRAAAPVSVRSPAPLTFSPESAATAAASRRTRCTDVLGGRGAAPDCRPSVPVRSCQAASISPVLSLSPAHDKLTADEDHRRRDGRVGIGQDDRRRHARRGARGEFPRRRPSPTRQCREDAQRHAPRRCRSPAVLRAIAAEIDRWRQCGEGGVVTCSALKRAYRDISSSAIGRKWGWSISAARAISSSTAVAQRHEHFMPVGLLESQFATLQEPDADEHPIVVEIKVGPPRSWRTSSAA